MRTRNKRHIIPDGIISPSSRTAQMHQILALQFGFECEIFEGYLWKYGKEVWVPFIVSKEPGQGNLRKLFSKIERRGYKIVVPTPFTGMQRILLHMGFHRERRAWEDSEDFTLGILRHGRTWEHHRMGLKIQGLLVPSDEQVEIWLK